MFCICNIISFSRIGYWKTLKRMKVEFHEFQLKTTIYIIFLKKLYFLQWCLSWINFCWTSVICTINHNVWIYINILFLLMNRSKGCFTLRDKLSCYTPIHRYLNMSTFTLKKHIIELILFMSVKSSDPSFRYGVRESLFTNHLLSLFKMPTWHHNRLIWKCEASKEASNNQFH